MKAKTDLRTIKTILRAALGAAAGLLALTGAVRADDSVTMAPPVAGAYSQDALDAPANASADTVFKWTETPEGEQVPIARAAFDQGGYQLYDTQGETIVVPFTNNNLYVMKFGRSTNGHTYFVNEGAVPVLYVPQDGFLENAAVPGARWYPFSKGFHPDHPVFEGIAPSYSDFVGMGWYPDMQCFGGYYGSRAFATGGVFLPAIGLFFQIGGHPYYGWGGYRDYDRFHDAPYRTVYYQRDVYHYADRPASDFHRFDDGDRPYYAHQTFQGGGFGGGGHFGGGSQTFNNGGGHDFGGGSFGGGGFGGGGFGGGQASTDNGNSTFRGAGPRPGISRGGDQAAAGRNFGGGGPSFGGGNRTFTGGGHDFGGGGGFGGSGGGGGGSQGGSRTFTNAGNDNSRSNGPRSSVSRGGNQNNGDRNSGGGNQNGGGGGSNSGGGGRSFNQGNDQGNARGGGFGGGNGGSFGGGGGFSGGAHVRGGR